MSRGRDDAGMISPGWVDAAAVFGVLASVLLLAKQVRPVVAEFAWRVRLGDDVAFTPSVTQWARIAAWLLVTVALLSGRRAFAAFGARVAVLGEVFLLVVRDPAYPLPVLITWLPFVLAAIVAIAVSVPSRPRGGVAVLGRLRTALFCVAGAVAAFAPIAIPFLAEAGDDVITIDQRSVSVVAVLTYGCVAALILGASVGLAAPVRRRLLTLVAVVATAWAVVLLFYPGLWFALVAAPLLVLAAGLAIVHLQERLSTVVG